MSRKMQHIYLAIVSVLAIVTSSLLASSTAYASTVYDGAYTSLNALQVSQNHFYNSSSCGATNLTYDWQSYITDPSAQLATGYNSDYASLRSSFEAALASGSYAVSVNMDTTPTSGQYMETAVVYWTDDGDAQLNWTTSSPYYLTSHYVLDMTSAGGHIHFAQIGNEAAVIGSGGCKVGWGYPDTTNYSNLSSFYNYLSTDNWTSPPSGSYHASANLLVANTTLNMPSSYTGTSVATSAPPAQYVAMGDSYSSGEGNAPFDIGTDISGVDMCHRSTDTSYPKWLSQYGGLSLGLTDYVACSGATTDTLLNGGSGDGAWNEPAQISALSASTDRVTFTIGGNDAGFSTVLGDCVKSLTPTSGAWGCSSDSTVTGPLSDRLAALDGSIVPAHEPANGRTIRSLLDLINQVADAAPNASIYVGGYPELFGTSTTDYDSDSSAPGGYTCTVGFTATVSYTDAQWINSQADDLDTIISNAVDAAHDAGVDVTYVPPTLFDGHGLCDSGTSYLYGAEIESSYAVSPGSMHPDSSGQTIAYGLMFQTKMS